MSSDLDASTADGHLEPTADAAAASEVDAGGPAELAARANEAPSELQDDPPAKPKAAPDLLDWQTLPVAHGRKYFQYSTRDREREDFAGFDPKNKDFNNFVAVCGEDPRAWLQTATSTPCDPGLSGIVLASDDAGPGFVSRIWFAAGGNGFVDERIRIFADDLHAPVYEAPLSTWSNGVSDPFISPLTLRTSNAVVSYVPIAYQHKLRVLIDRLSEGGLYYNQTNVQRGQDVGRGFAVQSAHELSELEQRVHAAAGSELAVEQTWNIEPQHKVDLFERAASGTITQLRLKVAASTPLDLRTLYLRMHWERAEMPAVEMPLSAFFAAELAVAEYHTLPLTAAKSGEDLVLEANWPLPYFEHARISLENTGPSARSVTVRVQQHTAAPAQNAGHFHALYQHSVAPFDQDDRHQVAALQGHGKYVGTVMFMQGALDNEAVAARYPLGFLEGDERILVDGAESVLGTGTEDYFDAGYYWGSGRFDAPFATLISRAEDADGGSVTAARWHVLTNSIEFDKSLDFTFEYGAPRPMSATDYASVAYYYLFR